MNIYEKEAALREGILEDKKQLVLSLSMWTRWAKDPIVYGVTAKTAKNIIKHLQYAIELSKQKFLASQLRESIAKWESING